MINIMHFKNDLKQVAREPIMLMLFLMPVLYLVIFKLMLVFLVPYLNNFFVFDIADYHSYILSITMILCPGMLGTVMGFLMLDEKDGKIQELMSITPLGRKGYLFNRLSFAVLGTVFYVYLTYFIMNIYYLPMITLFYLSLLLGNLSIIIGLILFTLAEDKVKGLTYAKGLNVIVILALADLVDNKWIGIFSSLFPTYWVTKIIKNPMNVSVILLAAFVNIVWLVNVLIIDKRNA